MKTYKHLYPLITDFENLRLAFKNAARGKRSRPDVAAFEYDLERNLLDLQAELRSQTYTPGPYTNFRITDPKPRLISAAPFRDRVAHHALCRVIEPIFERKFTDDTYACRVGKGTHAALDRAQHFARRYPYVLKCDLEHFFPNNVGFRVVSHDSEAKPAKPAVHGRGRGETEEPALPVPG